MAAFTAMALVIPLLTFEVSCVFEVFNFGNFSPME